MSYNGYEKKRNAEVNVLSHPEKRLMEISESSSSEQSLLLPAMTSKQHRK